MTPNPISEKNARALEHFPPLHREDYRGFKQDFMEWMLEKGKNPVKHDGYSENTLRQTHYKLEEVFRYLWNAKGEYTTEIPPEDADEFLNSILGRQKDKAVMDFVKSIKRFHKYQNHTKEKHYDWDYENKDELSVSANSKTVDYFKREEMHALYEASLSKGSVKSYHNKKMTDDERDRIKIHLAQRFEKQKSEVTPEDFSRANSWKFPSIVSTCIDIGLRPIEVGKAKVSWVNTNANEIIIPAREATKNDSPWECKISNKTARALDTWLDERATYEKYQDSDNLWLTKHGNPYGSNSLNGLLDRLMEETDIRPHGRKLTWYSIRRGCATMWANDGGIEEAQEQLRHLELKTTLTYTSSPGKTRENRANDLW